MDAMKILGGLLGSGSMTSGQGGNLLGSLLGGGGGGGGDLGSVLGQALGGGGASTGSGGLGDVLGQVLGGGGSSAGRGGLGDVLGQALGGGAGSGSGGGLGDMLGGALGGGGGSRGSGGLGGALGGMAVAALLKYASGRMSGGGTTQASGLLGSGGQGLEVDLSQFETPETNAQAELLIEAMINAAKADGRVDASEERAILERLGDLDPDEVAFVQSKLRENVDAAGFAARVPAGMAQEVYAASLLAVELDDRSEALYLRDLARGLGLEAQRCNEIHQEMGAPQIFR